MGEYLIPRYQRELGDIREEWVKCFELPHHKYQVSEQLNTYILGLWLT